MLFIDNETVRQVLTIEDAINAQDRAFRGLVDGGSIHRPRIDVYVPTGREDDYYRWGTMEGASRDLGVFAIRMKSDVVSWPADANGNWTEEKSCVEPGTYCGLIFLFSTVNGEPLAIINDGHLQHARVGAGDSEEYLTEDGTPERLEGESRVAEHARPHEPRRQLDEGVLEGDRLPACPAARTQQAVAEYGDIVIPADGLPAFRAMGAGEHHGFVLRPAEGTNIQKRTDRESKHTGDNGNHPGFDQGVDQRDTLPRVSRL